MVRLLPDADVADLLSLPSLLPVVEEALLKQERGAVERPERPHFPVGTGLDPDAPDEPLGTGLTMPAYVHGDEHFATKLVSVHEDNPERGLPTVHAQVALTDAATGEPVAYMAGERITNARTGCIGGLAARTFADPPVTLALVGAGTQARWQARAVAAATDLASVRVYSPSDSKHRCASDLEEELGVEVTAADSPRAAVAGADVVVTATTARDPVFPGDALAPHALVVAVGAYTAEMRELDATTFERAARVYADVPEEVAEIGDVAGNGVDSERLRPLAEALEDPPDVDGIVVVESVGTAVLDAATAGLVYERALEADAGRDVPL